MAAQRHLRWHRYQHHIRDRLFWSMHIRMWQPFEIPPSSQLTAMHLNQKYCYPCILCLYWPQCSPGLDHGSSTYQHYLAFEYAEDDKILGVSAYAYGRNWQYRIPHSIRICQEFGTGRYVLQEYWQARILFSHRARTWNSSCLPCSSQAAVQTMPGWCQVRVQHTEESRSQQPEDQRHRRV